MTGYVSLGHVVFYGLGAYLVGGDLAGEYRCARDRPAAGVLAAAFAALVGIAGAARARSLLRDPDLRARRTGQVQHHGGRVGQRQSPAGSCSARPTCWSSTSRCSRWRSPPCCCSTWVSGSRFGHGLRSLRENEEAAETLGVPIVRYKLLAFVLSAAIPGMVGGRHGIALHLFRGRTGVRPDDLDHRDRDGRSGRRRQFEGPAARGRSSCRSSPRCCGPTHRCCT